MRDKEHSMNRVTRRGLLQTSGLAAAGVAAACAPAAAPATTPGRSSGSEPWQVEWDALVEAAKKERTVVVQTAVGTGYRDALDLFAKAFPGIEPEQQAFPDGATYIPKIQGERKAGIYTFDVAAVPAIPPLQVLKYDGTYDPLRPALFRPDVLDDKAWFGGFESRWADIDKTLAFRFQAQVTRPLYVNTNLIKETDIKSWDDLLDPKYKGKIVMSDVAQGYVYSPSTILREIKGEAWLRKLLVDQEPEQIRDRRQAVEALVRGKAPIGFGLHPFVMQDFMNEGLANHIKNIEVPDGAYAGGDTVLIFNRAPHPNAAKLFINWLLTKEGGETWSSKVRANSARTDVPIVEERFAPKPSVTYRDPSSEINYKAVGETQEFLNKTVGKVTGS